MKEIRIENFITIKLLQFKSDVWVYFVDYYNEKYFYTKEDNRLCTHQITCGNYRFYFQKANIIHRSNLNGLEQDVYKLYRQLTFKIERAKIGETYYFITDCFEVKSFREEKYPTDNKLYKSFNYFVSKAEAEKCAKILSETLIELRKEDYANGE